MPIRDENQNPLELLAGMSSGGGRKHAVPQNVMDVEFKVVGDITLRQLGFLCLGGAAAYLFYNSGLPSFWALTLAGFSILLALGIAFLPIQERPLDKWVVLFIKAMFYETQLIWRKSTVTPAYFLSDYADVIKNEIITLTPVKSRSKLDEYLGLIPEDQDDMDLYQASKMTKIAEKLETQLKEPAKLASNIKPIKIKESVLSFPEQKTIPQEPAKKNFDLKPENKTDPDFPLGRSVPMPIPTEEEIYKDEAETKLLIAQSYNPSASSSSPVIQPKPENKAVDRPIKSWPKKYESQLRGEIKIKTTAKLPLVIVSQDIKEIKEQEVSLEKKIEELMIVASKAKKELEGQGLNLNQSDRIEYFRNKYHELKKEKENLKTELVKNTSRVNQIEEDHKKKDLEDLVQTLTKQNEDLENKLEFIQDQLFLLKNQRTENMSPASSVPMQIEPKNPASEKAIRASITAVPAELLQQSDVKQVKEKTVLMPDQLPSERVKAQRKNISTLQKNIPSQPAKSQEELNKEENLKEMNFLADKMVQGLNQASKLSANSFSMSKLAQKNLPENGNIIYGTVKDQNSVLSENTVVLIKDVNGDVIRALKTNKLGQFKTQTPVENGIYLIEAIKGGENFDIIRIEANGSKLNPVYMIGKSKEK